MTMRVAITAVGKRTEHWEGFFEALARTPGIEVRLLAADVSELGRRRLEALAREHDRFDFRCPPHVLGEDLTGHMASVVFAPGSFTWLREFRPDVLHLIGEPAYLSTAQAISVRDRHLPGTPISHYAAQNVVIRFPWPFPLLEQRAYRKLDVAFPITPAAEDVLRTKGYAGATRIVPLGVDRQRFTPREGPPEGPFTVGFVGRLERHKGVADLVVAAERAGVRLLLAGEGSLRPWLEQEAARRPGSIELAGWADHDELPQLLRRMHVLCLPSIEIIQRTGIPLREQFGRVLVEAMATGVPVVATRVGEIPFVVGSAGMVTPPEDPTALAEAFSALRDDPELAQRLTRDGLERSARFDWQRIVGDTVSAWRELAGRQEETAEPGPAREETAPRAQKATTPISSINHQKGNNHTMDTAMNTRTTIAAIRRNIWIVLLSTLVAVAAGFGATRLMPERYESSATLFVNGDAGNEAAAGVDTAALAQRLAGSYARLAESGVVTGAAARRAGLPVKRVAGHIDGSASPEGQIITLTGSSSSAEEAAEITNAAAGALVERIEHMTGPTSPVTIERIDAAAAAAAPVAPRVGLSLLFAGLAGLAIGIALAGLRERLDDRLRTADGLEQILGVPVLAAVPKLGRRARRATAIERHANGALAEPHRLLAATIERIAETDGRRRLLITAPRGNEQHTTVAAHLALALSDGEQRTTIVEADLQRPELRRELAAEATPAFEELLASVNGKLPETAAIRPQLNVVAPVEAIEASGRTLRSAEFRHALDVAGRQSDVVVIDGPPTLGRADTAVLARHADGAIIVAALGESRLDDVLAARTELQRFGLSVAGVVLTNVS